MSILNIGRVVVVIIFVFFLGFVKEHHNLTKFQKVSLPISRYFPLFSWMSCDTLMCANYEQEHLQQWQHSPQQQCYNTSSRVRLVCVLVRMQQLTMTAPLSHCCCHLSYCLKSTRMACNCPVFVNIPPHIFVVVFPVNIPLVILFCQRRIWRWRLNVAIASNIVEVEISYMCRMLDSDNNNECHKS